MPVAHTRTGYKAYAYTAVSIGAQAMTSARVYNGLEMSGGSRQAVPRSERHSTISAVASQGAQASTPCSADRQSIARAASNTA